MTELASILSDHFQELCDKAAEIGVDWIQTADLIRGPGEYRPITFRAKDRQRSKIYVHYKGDGQALINFHTLDDGGRTVSWFGRKQRAPRFKRVTSWQIKENAAKAWLEAEAARQEAVDQFRIQRDAEAQKRRDEERKKREEEESRKEAEEEARRKEGHERAQAAWADAPRAEADHPYLSGKRLSDYLATDDFAELRETTPRKLYGWGTEDRLLMIRFVDVFDRTSGFQVIDESGDKRYTTGPRGQYKGAHAFFGDTDAPKAIFVAEGFASGYAARTATEGTFAMARDAGNLAETVQIVRAKFPGVRLLLVADNDIPTEDKLAQGNVGMYAAVQAAVTTRVQIVQIPPIGGKKTDAADVLETYGPEYLAQVLKDKSLRIKIGNTLDGIEWSLRFAPHRDHESLVGRLALAMGAPVRASRNEVWSRYLELVQLPMKKSLIMAKIDAVIFAIVGAVEELIGLEADVSLETVPNEKGHHVVPFDLVERILKAAAGGHHIILRAPMGTGKTERVVAALKAHFERFVYLCHRVSIAKDASVRLGLPNYKDMDAQEILFSPQFVSSVQSILAKRFVANGFNAHCAANFLVIDEASKLIAQCISLGSRFENIIGNTNTFVEAIRTSGSALFIDADANNTLAETIAMIDERPITVIDITHPEGAGMKWAVDLFEDRHDLVMQLMKCLEEGRSVRVATDNRRWARTLETYIERYFPAVTKLCVTREPNGEERTAIDVLFGDPNAAITDYKVLIHTPVISSGFSITVPHFERSFGFFFGTVGATECMQKMGRDRTACDWAIWIRKTMVDGEEATADAREAEYTSGSLHTRLSHIFRRESIKERKNLDLLLPLLLQQRGHAVRLVKKIDVDSLEIMKKLQEIADELEQERIANIITLGEKPVSDEEYESLQKVYLRTKNQEARVIAYEVLNHLGGELSEDDIVFFEKHAGVHKANIMECLLASQEEASWHDENAPDSDYGHIHAVEKRALLREAIRILGLGEKIEGEFDVASARELVVWAKSVEQKMHAHFPGVISVHREVKYGVSLVKRLLRAIGLELTKRKTNGRYLYAVSPESLERMNRYVERRHELNRALIRRIVRTENQESPIHQTEAVVDFAVESFDLVDEEDIDLMDDDNFDLSAADYAVCEEWLTPPDEPF
jgi:phage/plasmid primase-like uncharacterized protein